MAAETFDLCSEFPYSRTSVRRAVSTPDDSPIVQCRDVNERELRVFKLEWSGAPRQILARIKDLYREKTFGPTAAMNFTPQGESQIEVRFLRPTLEYVIRGANSVDVTLELEEVR